MFKLNCKRALSIRHQCTRKSYFGQNKSTGYDYLQSPNLPVFSHWARLLSSSKDSISDLERVDDSFNAAPEDPFYDQSFGSVGDLSTVGSTVIDSPVKELSNIVPSDLAIKLVENVHSLCGLAYWQAIILTTISLRLLLLPIQLDGMRMQGRLKKAMPEIKEMQEKINARLQAQSQGGPPFTLSPDENVMKKYNIKYSRIFMGMGLQGGVFISLFFGLRKMGEYFPLWSEGGTAWFRDLSALDQTYALPVLAGAAFLVTVENMPLNEQVPQSATMKQVFRGMALFLPLVGMSMPSGVLVYWVTNNAYGALMSKMLSLEGIRKSLNLPSLNEDSAVLHTFDRKNVMLEKPNITSETEDEIFRRNTIESDENRDVLRVIRQIKILSDHEDFSDETKMSAETIKKYRKILDAYKANISNSDIDHKTKDK